MQVFGKILTLLLVGAWQLAAAESEALRPADRAFRFFAGVPTPLVGALLESLRPLPISEKDKHLALSTLPIDGQLQPTPDEVTKLSSIERVLIYHKRQDVFEAKVIDLPYAAIVLHARSILLITRPALRLLSAMELQAVVAHEAGHEYFWTEFLHLRDGDHAEARQELELRCDAIAVLTMAELRLDAAHLISAIRKVTLFNQRLGATIEAANHPSATERARFAQRMVDAYRQGVER